MPGLMIKEMMLTHKDVNKSPRHLAVLGHEERELFPLSQLSRQRQVGYGDIPDRDHAASISAETVREGCCHGFVFIWLKWEEKRLSLSVSG